MYIYFFAMISSENVRCCGSMVELWSSKPKVAGSSPVSTTILPNMTNDRYLFVHKTKNHTATSHSNFQKIVSTMPTIDTPKTQFHHDSNTKK